MHSGEEEQGQKYLGVKARTGFETLFSADGYHQKLSARAVAANGTVIGRTKTVTVQPQDHWDTDQSTEDKAFAPFAWLHSRPLSIASPPEENSNDTHVKPKFPGDGEKSTDASGRSNNWTFIPGEEAMSLSPLLVISGVVLIAAYASIRRYRRSQDPRWMKGP